MGATAVYGSEGIYHVSDGIYHVKTNRKARIKGRQNTCNTRGGAPNVKKLGETITLAVSYTLTSAMIAARPLQSLYIAR